MTIQEIKELLDLFHASGVDEMEVQRGDNRVRLRRAPVNVQHVVTGSAAAGTPARESTDAIVHAPILGTYYDAPKPGDPPFVNVGDSVERGQTLCIIETMKLMNEIEAEVAGVITAKHVENGKPVEHGDALFSIRPR